MKREEKVGKKGVVREKSTHIEVVTMILDYASTHGFHVLDLTFSPIKGPEGNIEYLLHLSVAASPQDDFAAAVSETVAAAHLTLQPIRR